MTIKKLNMVARRQFNINKLNNVPHLIIGMGHCGNDLESTQKRLWKPRR